MKFFSGNKIMKASILDDGLQTSLLLHHNYHFVTLLLSHTQFSPLYQHKKKNYVAVTEIRIRTHFEEFDLNIFCHLWDFTVCIEAGVGFASCDITAFWLKSFSLSYRLSGPVECDVIAMSSADVDFPIPAGQTLFFTVVRIFVFFPVCRKKNITDTMMGFSAEDVKKNMKAIAKLYGFNWAEISCVFFKWKINITSWHSVWKSIWNKL